MMIRLLGIGTMMLLAFNASQAVGQISKLPTLDEALKISQSTGRPIFAMAGQGT